VLPFGAPPPAPGHPDSACAPHARPSYGRVGRLVQRQPFRQTLLWCKLTEGHCFKGPSNMAKAGHGARQCLELSRTFTGQAVRSVWLEAQQQRRHPPFPAVTSHTIQRTCKPAAALQAGRHNQVSNMLALGRRQRQLELHHCRWPALNRSGVAVRALTVIFPGSSVCNDRSK